MTLKIDTVNPSFAFGGNDSLQTDPDAAGARRPRRQRAAQDKAAILEAARILFLTERYELISSVEIARRAGVEETLPARYFGGKLALLIRVGEDMAEEALGEFETPLPQGLVGEQAVRAVAAQALGVLAGRASQLLHNLFSAQAREAQRLNDRWRQRFTATVADQLRGPLGPAAEAAAGRLYDLYLSYAASGPGEPAASPREIAAWAEAAAAMLVRRWGADVLESDPPAFGGQDADPA